MAKRGKRPYTRRFNGEIFIKKSTHSKKSIAEKKATQMRKTGDCVRVVPTKTPKGKKTWTLYAN